MTESVLPTQATDDRPWFTLLGPVRGWAGRDELDLGSPQQRAVLALLLSRSGRAVTLEQLIYALWGDRPPASAGNTVRTYVHRLRRALSTAGSGTPIVTVGAGYLLTLEESAIDVEVFRSLTAQADTAARAHDPDTTADRLDAALRMWGGEPLTGATGEWIEIEREHLRRAYGDVLFRLAELELALGRRGRATEQLPAAVAENPLDERLARLLMRQLYGSDQAAAALTAYDRTRRALSEQLGTSPGPQLQELHLTILRGEASAVPTLAVPVIAPDPVGPGTSLARKEPEPTPVTDSGSAVRRRISHLPPDLVAFAGRRAEIEALDALLPPEETPAAGLVTLHGMAGIGKTALAIHWAHRVAPRFPDGQFFLDMRGFDAADQPLAPGDALRAVLGGLGLPIPGASLDLPAQLARYRELMAGRQVLVVFDNVRDAAHVRDLLPGVPGSLVLVTSRNRMSALVVSAGARPVPVGVLSGPDATELLLRRLAGLRQPDRQTLATLVEFCAGLPLALSVVAVRAILQPGLPLTGLAEQLRADGQSLDFFTDPDASIDLRSVFSWSYHRLSPLAACLLRVLARQPEADLGLAQVAVLVGMDLRSVRAAARELTIEHLADEQRRDGLVLHPLVRAFAQGIDGISEPSPGRGSLREVLAAPSSRWVQPCGTNLGRVGHRPSGPVAGAGKPCLRSGPQPSAVVM